MRLIRMTSVGRAYYVRKEGVTSFVKPESPSYNDDVNVVLFPFSYSNGVLDITYDGNNFKTNMVDNLNESPNSETDTAIRIISGPSLVTSLGNNFKDYIRSWRSVTIDAGSPIEVVVAAEVLRVQEGSFNNVSADSGDSWKISTSRPSGDNYITGSEANKYNTTYIFKTPLTFSIVESGVTQYITFKSMLDQE
jgi:hypothetical protein